MKKWIWMAAALAVAALVWALWPASDMPLPSPELLRAAQGLDEIRIEAQLYPEQRRLTVVQEMHLQNRTGQTLDTAVLRTWPNAFQSVETSPCAAEEDVYAQCYPAGFSSGALVVGKAEANGQRVLHRYQDEAKTVLRIPVPGGWKEGETAIVRLTYTVEVPRAAYRFGVWEDVWALGNAFAVPAVWEDGAFRTDAYAPVGDPFVSDCANYQVQLTVPKGYVCVGSGLPAVEASGTNQVYRFDSPAVRDFALVISNRFETVQAVENGVCITACAQSRAHAKALLKAARKALDCYGKRYGAYAYPSYTVAQVSMPHSGMEYPQLAMIAGNMLQRGGRELEYAVAHETAHQWWYAAVGSDGWHQSWQDEALCEFSVLEYAETFYGQGERDDLERSRMESAMRVTVAQGVTPGAPLDTFRSMSEYMLVVYHRGAACLCALDRTAAEGLDGFLRSYYAQYAFARASRGDFEQLLHISTGEDLTPLLRDYLDTNIRN